MSDVEWPVNGTARRTGGRRSVLGTVMPDSAGGVDGEGAFTDYVRAARPALLRAARTITGNSEDSEDLLQEGLLRTYGAYRRIEDDRAVGAYVRRTMSNHHISQWRRRRFDEFPCADVPDGPEAADPLDPVELRGALRGALARLGTRDRLIIGLRYFAAHTDSEIADRLGISVGTVKSSLWRSLRKLREDAVLREVHAELGSVASPLAAVTSITATGAVMPDVQGVAPAGGPAVPLPAAAPAARAA